MIIVPNQNERWYVKDPCGMGTVAVVYLLFGKIYLFTMIYSLGEGLRAGDAEDILHAIFFTLLFLLALVSHI